MALHRSPSDVEQHAWADEDPAPRNETAPRKEAAPRQFSRGDRTPQRSVIIPVYNGAATVADVVDGVFEHCAAASLEVVLVNDGSRDDSERVCRALAAKYPGRVTLVQLSRNSGEQRAVLTGLRQCRGHYAAIIDDDGQQPAEEVARLFEKAEEQGHDVVFGRYTQSRHAWHRRFVSRVHNAAAGRLFGKPPGLYLSSFKVVNRYMIDRLVDSSAPFVNIDAMVLQISNRFVQVDVEHRERGVGRSGYTYRKLFAVWFEALLGYSLVPFRGAMAIGVVTCLAALGVVAVRALSIGVQAVGAAPIIVLLLGIVVFYLGLLGECVVRWSNASDASASSIVRYIFRKADHSA